MQPRPNIAFCPNCRKPKDPNEVTCSQCGTRSCPNGHTMVSRICSLCGWEDRGWKPQTRSYSAAATPVQKSQEVPDARESVCPRCKVRTIITSGRCINCGYIFESGGQYGGAQQKAASTASQAGRDTIPGIQHDVVHQQFPGVHDAGKEYVCPRCGAKADPRDGGCNNCGYIGSLEYVIPPQQVTGMPQSQSSASVRQQSFAGQQSVYARDVTQTRACPFCGGSIPSDSKFCQQCGKPSGSGRQQERHILATDRAMSGYPVTMGQMVAPLGTAYAAEYTQSTPGTFIPGAEGFPIPEREFPREKIKAKKGKEKDYIKEKKGFPLGLLAAVLVVAAALVAMIIFTASQIFSTPASPTATPVADTTPPVISDVSISTVSGSSATIDWNTNERSTSRVMLCDPNGTCSYTDPNTSLVKYHTVTVNNVNLDVNYHVTVESIDASGNISSSEMEHVFATEVQDTIPVGYEVGNRAPNFTLKDLDGNSVTLSSFKGKKLVMVNFWAVTCASCVAELPDFEEVYQARSSAVEVLAVNAAGEDKVDVQAFIENEGYTFTVLLDSEGTVKSAYNVPSWPRTFFIDKEGIIKNIKIGQISKTEINTILNGMQ